MKGFKKVLAWLALASMVAVAAAETDPVPRAAAPMEIADYAHYPSRTYDEATGTWTLHSVQADALIDRFWNHKISNGETFCAFYLEAEGNALTGVWTPVLKVLYNGSKTLDATAVSILADGIRYDFAAASEKIQYEEKYSAQLVNVPLNVQAAAALAKIAGAQEISVRLIGENVYAAKIDPDATAARRRIEAASLAGLESGLALMSDLNLSEYELWDLSEAAWNRKHGFAPMFVQGEAADSIGETPVDDDFGMVMRGDQTRAARTAQEILIESGFMSGSASGTFTQTAADAVRRAQQYLGRIVTGCMDAGLEKALDEGRKVASSDRAEAEVMQSLGGAAEIALTRYWFADGVSASCASDISQSVYNSDNAFLVADGRIRNISTDEMYLFMQMSAQVICNGGYAYDASVACECDGGSELDSLLLPMGSARMLVYAEVPAELMNDDAAEWKIRFEFNGEALEYALE